MLADWNKLSSERLYSAADSDAASCRLLMAASVAGETMIPGPGRHELVRIDDTYARYFYIVGKSVFFSNKEPCFRAPYLSVRF